MTTASWSRAGSGRSRGAFGAIERILGRAGAVLSDLVRMAVFTLDLADYGEFSPVRAERFGDQLRRAPRSRWPGLLLGARIEIYAIGFVPE